MNFEGFILTFCSVYARFFYVIEIFLSFQGFPAPVPPFYQLLVLLLYPVPLYQVLPLLDQALVLLPLPFATFANLFEIY